MSIIYELLGMPQNIDEVVDLLRKRRTDQATINVTEAQHEDRIIYVAAIELGHKRFLGDQRYVVDRKVVWLTPGSDGFHKADESMKSYDGVFAEAEKTRDYLTGQGISAIILKNKECPWKHQ